jgi:cobalt-zinc-cadmium efflux system membrane fusion protein
VRYGDWFEARPLELGRSDGTWVEVVKGLKAGERYAATNSFAVKAEIGKLGASHDH